MEQSGGRSRVLCWELVGLVCFAGGYTSKQGDQEESREIKGSQGKSRGSRGVKGKQGETMEIKGSQGDQCEPRENEMK